MKIQLDFDKKTVVVDSSANLGDLVGKLQDLLHDWQDWSLLPIRKVEYLPSWDDSKVIPLSRKDLHVPYISGNEYTNWPDVMCKSEMPTTGVYNIELL